MKKFSISEAIKFGWETTKQHLRFLIGVVLIISFVNLIPNITNSQLQENEASLLLAVIGIVFWVLNMLVSIGGIKISLELVDKKKAEFADLFNAYPLLINFIIGSILYALIVVVGLLLLIIPGIYLGIKLHFYSYFIVDKKLGPIEALKESSRITQGTKWQLFLFVLVMGLLNIAGALALFVGLLITIPITMMAYAYVYRKLLGSAPAAVSSNPATT